MVKLTVLFPATIRRRAGQRQNLFKVLAGSINVHSCTPPNDAVSVGSIHMCQEISGPRTSINVKKSHVKDMAVQFTTQVLRILNDFQFISVALISQS